MPAHLLSRLPKWFVAQQQAIERRALRRREVDMAHSTLDLLNGTDVRESGWAEWQDTVAAFSAPAQH